MRDQGAIGGSAKIRIARLRLVVRGLKSGWTIFAESKIGLLGLGIILSFALLALAHPILMATV